MIWKLMIVESVTIALRNPDNPVSVKKASWPWYALLKYDTNWYIASYTTLTNFSTNYLVLCKVYNDVGGI